MSDVRHRFNWAVRKLHKRLGQLGAREFYARGEADEQHDEGLVQLHRYWRGFSNDVSRLDAGFVPWIIDLRRYLLEFFPLDNGLIPIPDEFPIEPRWVLTLKNSHATANGLTAPTGDAAACSTAQPAEKECSDRQSIPTIKTDQQHLKVILEENKRLTPESHWQDVRQLKFTSSSISSYGPGDVLTIFPKNQSGDVDKLLTRMGWTAVADEEMTFVRNSNSNTHDSYPPPPIEFRSTTIPMTLRTLLTNSLDLTAIPKRSFFSLMAHFTDDQMQKERLLDFTKPEYIDELYDYTTRPRRSILEVLQEFDTVNIPWQWAAKVLPELRGRQFSIASGGQLKTDARGHSCFELLVAIVRYKTVIKKTREGVCTRYLAALAPGSSLDVLLQKGSLGVTLAQAGRPLVMIGPGTGIAPIRSLIWERLQWREELSKPQHAPSNGNTANQRCIGEMALFFGCRKKEVDYFYQSEWEEMQGRLPLRVFTAFSRDQKHKVYVQDLIKEQSELIYRLLHESRGMVYVCGSSGQMPKAVRRALTQTFLRHGDMHQEDAEAYLLAMEKEGRYKQETW